MNEAAKLVSDSLTGNDFQTVFIAGKAYIIHPPTAKIMARGLGIWADFDFDEKDQTNLTVIGQMPQNIDCLLKGLAMFVAGDVQGYERKARRLYKQWRKGTPSADLKEVIDAAKITLNLIPASDFFAFALSLKSALKMIAKAR